jgi:O-antigen/teichoic acid export membrane protein
MNFVTSKFLWVLKGQGGAAATLRMFSAKIFVLALNIGTGVLTARALGPDGRGEMAAIMLWPVFLPYLMSFGLPLALLYNIKKHPQEELKLYGAALMLGNGLGIASALIGILLMPILLKQYTPEVIHIAQCFMLSAPSALLGLIFLIPLQARGEFEKINQLSYFPPLFTLIVLVGLVLTKSITILTACLAYVIPPLPIFFWLLSSTIKRFPPQWHNLGRDYKQLMSYGLRVYGIDLLNTLSGQISQLLVVGLLKPVEMGLYVIAMALSRMLNLLQNSVTYILVSKATACSIEEVVAMTGQAVRASTALTALAALGLIISVQTIIPLLYGTKFIEAVAICRVLSLEAVIGGTVMVLMQAFMALGKPEVVTISQTIGLAISVPMMLVLIPQNGLLGAGFSLLGSTVVRLIFILISYPIILKTPPPNLMINSGDFRFIQKLSS